MYGDWSLRVDNGQCDHKESYSIWGYGSGMMRGRRVQFSVFECGAI